MSEETRISILDSSQSYLTENPGIPQKNYQGKHSIDVQLPKDDLTDEQLQDFVQFVFKQSDLDGVLAQCRVLALGKIRTEIKNQGNAKATRAPQASSTIGKKWKQVVSLTGSENQLAVNLDMAQRMFQNFSENADMFDLTERQIATMETELEKLQVQVTLNDVTEVEASE